MISFSVKLCVLLSAFFGIEGTLVWNGMTPDNTVSLDCGSQQTFTCTVTGPLGSAAGWNVSGLSGIIMVTTGSGFNLANANNRISTNDTSITLSSTITITGFSTSDSGGTVQCVNQVNNDVQGLANILVGRPFRPTSFSANRDGDFTSATVIYQLNTSRPVTSTTVTYCPIDTSSSNCGNIINCTSPCTISGLDPCVKYNLSAIPINNCGNVTGSTMVVDPQGTPSYPTMVHIGNSSRSGDSVTCKVMLTWQQPSNSPPVTFTTVTYCPPSPQNCEDMNCTSPCTISGLRNDTDYQFTVVANNNCGKNNGSSENMATFKLPSECTIEETLTNPATTTPVEAIAGGVVGGSAGLAIAALVTYAIAVLIAVLCCSSCEGRSYCYVFFCQYCCGGESKRPSSTRPMPADDYADPKKVREKKEKEEKIQYAALEFSEQAGSSGEKPIRSKEEPVQYFDVEQA